ncbi:MAG: hypothetical protein NW224_04810 [Leptolyngbyaceae cyanobacterium bins.302]|nr:hypothetical protein [Leptolyngbyaceae cyanobacterium bins.302]
MRVLTRCDRSSPFQKAIASTILDNERDNELERSIKEYEPQHNRFTDGAN